MSPRDLALLINYCSCLIPQRPPRASLSDTPPLPLVALPPTPSRARSEACASQIQNWKKHTQKNSIDADQSKTKNSKNGARHRTNMRGGAAAAAGHAQTPALVKKRAKT